MLTFLSDSAGPSNDPPAAATTSSKRKSARNKKGGQGLSYRAKSSSTARLTHTPTDTVTPSGRRSKKTTSSAKDGDNTVDNSVDEKAPPPGEDDASDDNEDEEMARHQGHESRGIRVYSSGVYVLYIVYSMYTT